MDELWQLSGKVVRCIVNKDNIRLTPFFMIMVVFYLAANFVHPVTPTLIQNLNLHDYMFGVALAAMMLTNFLVSPFWGKLNNRVNSRCIILVCCIGYGLSQLGFAFGTTEFQIIAARMMAAFFIFAVCLYITYYVSIPVLQDIIVKEAVSGQENLVLGFYNSFKSLGAVFGSFAAGALYESSCKYPFICVFLVYGLAVVLCIFSLKRRAPYYVKRIPVRE